jgi:hypothetical protein
MRFKKARVDWAFSPIQWSICEAARTVPTGSTWFNGTCVAHKKSRGVGTKYNLPKGAWLMA